MAKKPTPVSKVAKTTPAPTAERDPILASKEEQERVAAEFRKRIDGFKLDKRHLIGEGELVSKFRPVSELSFNIYRCGPLWTLELAHDSLTLSVVRHAKEKADVHELIVSAALNAFLIGREDIAQYILNTFLSSLLRYQSGFVQFGLHDFEIGFTDTFGGSAKLGYLLFRTNGVIMADGFIDECIKQHIGRFNELYSDYCKKISGQTIM